MSFFDRSANKTAFLAATYTVQITDLFNATTGARRTPALVDAAWLRKTTGLNITAGSGTGPYTVDYPGYKLGQVGAAARVAASSHHRRRASPLTTDADSAGAPPSVIVCAAAHSFTAAVSPGPCCC